MVLNEDVELGIICNGGKNAKHKFPIHLQKLDWLYNGQKIER